MEDENSFDAHEIAFHAGLSEAMMVIKGEKQGIFRKKGRFIAVELDSQDIETFRSLLRDEPQFYCDFVSSVLESSGMKVQNLKFGDDGIQSLETNYGDIGNIMDPFSTLFALVGGSDIKISDDLAWSRRTLEKNLGLREGLMGIFKPEADPMDLFNFKGLDSIQYSYHLPHAKEFEEPDFIEMRYEDTDSFDVSSPLPILSAERPLDILKDEDGEEYLLPAPPKSYFKRVEGPSLEEEYYDKFSLIKKLIHLTDVDLDLYYSAEIEDKIGERSVLLPSEGRVDVSGEEKTASFPVGDGYPLQILSKFSNTHNVDVEDTTGEAEEMIYR